MRGCVYIYVYVGVFLSRACAPARTHTCANARHAPVSAAAAATGSMPDSTAGVGADRHSSACTTDKPSRRVSAREPAWSALVRAGLHFAVCCGSGLSSLCYPSVLFMPAVSASIDVVR